MIDCCFSVTLNSLYGSVKTNSRISLPPQAGSQQAKVRFYKIHALDKSDKHPDLYSLLNTAGDKIIFLK
jgi:hypothetical protein